MMPLAAFLSPASLRGFFVQRARRRPLLYTHFMQMADDIMAEDAMGIAAEKSHSGRSIAVSTLWQVASQFVMAVLSVVTVKFVTLGLSKELVGYYNSAYGFLQTFAILADFGLYAVSVREIAKAKDPERVFGVFLLLRCLIVALSFGAAVAAVWAMPLWRGTPFPIGVTIAAFVPVFTLLAGTIRTIFQVKYKMQFVFIAEVFQRIITTAGIGLFVFYGVRLSSDLSVYEWFLGIGGIGAFVLFLVSYFYALRFMRVRLSVDLPLLKKMFLLAAPYGVAYLLLTMYRQLDVVFIALLRPDFALQNAVYGLAGRVEDMAFLLPTFLLNSVLPVLSQDQDPNARKKLLSRTFFLLLLSGTIMFLFSFFLARPITLVFSSHAYLGTPGHPGADMAFRLMSIPMFLNGIVLYCFYVFLARQQWGRLMASFGVGVVLTIILNLLWTPSLGFVGAGSALIVVHFLLAIMLLPQALKVAPIHFATKEIFQWLTFSILFGASLFLAEPFLKNALETALFGVVSCVWIAILLWITRLNRLFHR